MCQRLGRALFALAIASALSAASAKAQTFEVLHGFENSAALPMSPTGQLVRDADGAIYGTTQSGGGDSQYGTIYKWQDGVLTTLHAFSGSDGANPIGGLVRGADGALYGTTSDGGPGRYGTLFRWDGFTLTTLHGFSYDDGANPFSGLTVGIDGSLYGTTASGGAGFGTIFKWDGAAITTLHTFASTDGAQPFGGVIQAADGALYGTTYFGASGYGTFYRWELGSLTTLHTFSGGDGAYSFTRPTQATDGTIYGATTAGGASNFGSLFKWDGKMFPGLHEFSGGDGAYLYSPLAEASDGALYGMATGGGPYGYGAIFKWDSGVFTVVHGFDDVDGASPFFAPLVESDGALYGVTQSGGPGGVGTIFRLFISRPTVTAVAAASGPFGGTTTLSATLSADGVGVPGKTVSFRLNGTSVGSAVTDASGVAELPRVSLAGIAVATYANGVEASFAGEPPLAPSSNTAALTVFDRVPPVLSMPANIIADATSLAGVRLSFVVTATDNADPHPTIDCLPTSGSIFAIGPTTVSCTASDVNGNMSAPQAFVVTVNGGAPQIVQLIDKTLAFVGHPALNAALRARLGTIAAAFVRNRRATVCSGLALYIQAVRAAGESTGLTAAEKVELINDATRIKAVVGCAG